MDAVPQWGHFSSLPPAGLLLRLDGGRFYGYRARDARQPQGLARSTEEPMADIVDLKKQLRARLTALRGHL